MMLIDFYMICQITLNFAIGKSYVIWLDNILLPTMLRMEAWPNKATRLTSKIHKFIFECSLQKDKPKN